LNADAVYSSTPEAWADYQATLARIEALRFDLEGKGLLAPRPAYWPYVL
jgi:hypothetical protein